MNLWLRTYVWTLFFEMLAVILSVLVAIGTIVSGVLLIDGQPSIILLAGLIACLIALTVWWRQARPFVSEPDLVLGDPRPFSARLAADFTTAIVGVGVVGLCIVQIITLGEPEMRWSLLATILGGPFIALGVGVARERWNKHARG